MYQMPKRRRSLSYCPDSKMTSSTYLELPPEILIKIFQYLDFYDVQIAGLCCKQWLAISKLPEFDSQGIFKINTCLLDNKKPAADVLFRKKITKLHMKDVAFGEDVDTVFQHIGTSLKLLNVKVLPIATALRLTMQYCTHLHTLQVLYIKQPNMLEGIETLEIAGLPNLKVLEMVGNDANVNTYLLLSSLQTDALETLTVDFMNTNENDVIRAVDKHSSSLTRLDIRLYEYSHLQVHRWLRIFQKLNLNRLILQGCIPFEIICFSTLNQHSLRFLDLTGCSSVNDEFLKILGEQRTALERLVLSFCARITDNGLKHLSSLTQLKVLDLSCCNLITPQGLRNIFPRPHSNLLELHMQELNLDGKVVSYCARNLPNLRVFNMIGCDKGVTDESVQEIFNWQPKIEDLRIDNCCHLTDSGILGIPTGCSLKNLKVIRRVSLRGCIKLTDATLIKGLIFPQLKFIDIARCDAITNRGLEALVINCPAIEEMYLSQNKGIDRNGFITLTNGLKRLRVLTVKNMKNPFDIIMSNWCRCRFRTITNEITFKRNYAFTGEF